MKDLNERLFKFSVDAILFLIKIKNIPEYSIIKYQLTKASTSSGANYEEAQAASSKQDFLNKSEWPFVKCANQIIGFE
jgi:four helix bundle protein